jgi:1-deoxy-D-xylulose-5-phosphate synthase
MPTGSSLKYMMQAFPDRAFDVGIAEQHAVTLAAGMATRGFTVFCAIYSTFLQRAYDQVIHDVAIQNLPVVFCLDRAGLVGEDGATHHGAFDISFLRCIPNMVIFAPLDEVDLRNMLYTAQKGVLSGPLAIRYPRGRGFRKEWQLPFNKLLIGKGKKLRQGTVIAVLSFGAIGRNVIEALEDFPQEEKIGHYDMKFAKPLDENLLLEIFSSYQALVTIEDGVIKGGFGSAIVEFAQAHNYHLPITRLGLPDEFLDHGKVTELQEIAKIDVDNVRRCLNDLLENY